MSTTDLDQAGKTDSFEGESVHSPSAEEGGIEATDSVAMRRAEVAHAKAYAKAAAVIARTELQHAAVKAEVEQMPDRWGGGANRARAEARLAAAYKISVRGKTINTLLCSSEPPRIWRKPGCWRRSGVIAPSRTCAPTPNPGHRSIANGEGSSEDCWLAKAFGQGQAGAGPDLPTQDQEAGDGGQAIGHHQHRQFDQASGVR